jgi:chaperonin GroES
MMDLPQVESMPMDAQLGPATEPQGMAPPAETDTSLRKILEEKNLLSVLKPEQIEELTTQVTEGYIYDLTSREEWEKNLEDWTNLALQVKEEKSYPWAGASNVKYPLLSVASMQFNARAYPSLIPATGDLVKCEVIGYDKQGAKLDQAKRVAKFMSYQILNKMDGWEESMDKLLIMLPIIGTLFKKTYYDKLHRKNCSELVFPKDLVVDYWAKDLETAERISHIILLNKRQVKERQMSGMYDADVELGEPQVALSRTSGHLGVKQDATLPYTFVEQHTYYDIDGDGYAEPYVVTFEANCKKIVRVVARFSDETIFLNDDGSLQKIEPIQYFTKFSFIPNPNGSFYDIGFGLLLSPINESVNTLINQLIDAGTLNNLQGGFLGKGIKLKMGGQQWTPGEWKTINNMADDLRKQILPLPTKEPSAVLFQLMGTLITSGKELASVAEIFVGKMPGQNTPATTTMATIEQGMKVFTAVYKRIYRSLKSEYKKLYELNGIYLDPTEYTAVLDIPVDASDFSKESYDICPSADPSTPTQTEKLLKAQGLLELLPTGILDPVEVVRRVLEAQEQPAYEQLFSQQVKETGAFQPPPDPKLQAMEMKGQLEQQKAQQKAEADGFKAQLAGREQEFRQAMEAQAREHDIQNKAMAAKMDAAISINKQRIFSVTEQAKVNQGLIQSDQKHSQSMRHNEEKLALQKQQTKTSSKTGKTTQ